MRFLKTVLSVFIFTSISLFPKFYSVRSQRELELKLQEFEYSFVCFAPLDQDGMHIKDVMKSLANSDDFQDVMDYGLVILFVYINIDTLPFALNLGYRKKPLFGLFKHAQIVAQSDLGQHYTVGLMKKFIFEAFAKDSDFDVYYKQECSDQDKADEELLHHHMHHKHSADLLGDQQDAINSDETDLRGYQADNEYENKPTIEEIHAAKMLAGYQPIDIMKKEFPYWWNRGSGNVDYGRGGLKYRAYFPKNIKKLEGGSYEN